MLERFRQFWTNVWAPLGNLLLRMGVSPNTVTFVGTLGVSAGAVIFFPQGLLLVGVLVITAFVFSDMIDGYMARTSGQVSKFGAFWDSTLDRIGDAAIFGGLAMYYVGPGDNHWFAALAIYCLSMGSVTSYARARAESLGMQAKVGIAERADRLVAILVVTGAADLVNRLGVGKDALWAIPVTLGVLAVASTVTVIQRVLVVRDQARALAAEGDTGV
ncbi:phosphatidylinositol phosphate synthase [Nocardioides pocheonensis]|uniref:Phosphatidylinositol phosphate synthase n=1 Tax=Nocardioides pocheonensis TaxID=661485 RepID=A0A3N0GMA1_9ACTN|nr:CDP-alcohol phosphatidyltransferase family protein [Nocardioides pocheonensis]RNM13268.1 CDP-alcohol phosphatidyltransferase family protein [Nocardioides pocheonensis]